VGFGCNWLVRYPDKTAASLGPKLARMGERSLVRKLPDEWKIKQDF